MKKRLMSKLTALFLIAIMPLKNIKMITELPMLKCVYMDKGFILTTDLARKTTSTDIAVHLIVTFKNKVGLLACYDKNERRKYYYRSFGNSAI